MIIRNTAEILALTREQAQAIVAEQQRLIAAMDRHICIEEFGEEGVEDWEAPSEADIARAEAIVREVKTAVRKPAVAEATDG